MRKVDVVYRISVVVNRVLPSPGVIQKLVRDRDLTRCADIRNDANRIQGNDRRSASLLQRQQICAVVDRVRRNGVSSRRSEPGAQL